MASLELKNGIYWVGAVDYDVRDFHGYATPQGTTYNAYLIMDEKIVLVDTVKKGFGPDLLSHIAERTDPARIDYIIVNHVEPDHSGALLEVLDIAKNATLVTSQKGREGLMKHYPIPDRAWKVVATGDVINIGRRNLKFVTAPMVHWPDSMFTYVVEDKVLLPNDAFGQHWAHPLRFADQVGEEFCMEEAAKYYANILMPLGPVIAKKIEELCRMGIAVDMIAPSHGAIWRTNTSRIIAAYTDWTAFKAKPKIVIVYDTMWHSTEKLARRLVELLAGQDIEVKIYSIRKSDMSQVMRDILDAKVLLIGSPTLNADMFWTLGGFLTYLRGLKPQKKRVGIFGSYGWAGGGSRAIRREVEAMGLEVIEPAFEVQYVPQEEELRKLEEYAKVVVRAAQQN